MNMAVDLTKVPSTPGVYKFFNNKEIIYIGKAKNLKKRVTSYFGNSVKDRKTSQIKFLTDNIETFTTKNEVEALLLEQMLIKENKPRFNILLRDDKTFGFSFINYSENFEDFNTNIESEKQRINESTALYPPINGLNCIHCSALPWFTFTSQKEPFSGTKDSVPKFAFSKTYKDGDRLLMNVGISVSHALVDGYHVGLFVEKFQENLNRP